MTAESTALCLRRICEDQRPQTARVQTHYGSHNLEVAEIWMQDGELMISVQADAPANE